MIVLLVALGAAVGAPTRYLTDRAVRARFPTRFPLGTLCVNVAASFVLGVVAGSPASGDVVALVATGFCGALSTFSTFSYEVFALAETGSWRTALLDVLVSVAGALAAVSLGWVLGSAL